MRRRSAPAGPVGAGGFPMAVAGSPAQTPKGLGAAEPFSFAETMNLVIIGLMAFLTVVDLFATQALLPALTEKYAVSAAEMGVAVNATTLGMAAAGLLVALVGQKLNRKWAIVLCLCALAVPTALLARAPDLASFAALRVVQGVLMATAFALTLAHLGETCRASASPAAFAAYVTGNVASNLFGRMLAIAAADGLGLEWNFYVFAALNIAGGALAFATISQRSQAMSSSGASALAGFLQHVRNPALLATFAIGFTILFAFIGVFTYINFEFAKPPLALPAAALCLVYFVFAPSILTTPVAGALVTRIGVRHGLWLGFSIAGLGLVLLSLKSLAPVLGGLCLVAIGTFLAQAIATGFTSRAGGAARAAASGLYLAAYFIGGLAGAAILGRLYVGYGWNMVLAGVAAALTLGAVLARALPKTR